jgi:hypothetical protein
MMRLVLLKQQSWLAVLGTNHDIIGTEIMEKVTVSGFSYLLSCLSVTTYYYLLLLLLLIRLTKKSTGALHPGFDELWNSF